MSAEEYVDYMRICLLVSFADFIRRAKSSIAEGVSPALIFQGVNLANMEKAERHFARERFERLEVALAAADALVIGFSSHPGHGRLSVVRHGRAGWRVRLLAVSSRGAGAKPEGGGTHGI